MSDKELEKNRYNIRAVGASIQTISSTDNFPQYLNIPYIVYQNMAVHHISSKSTVLEIGAGMGENTKFLLETNANIVATDISKESLKVIKRRFITNKLTMIVADMEELPFDDESFDMVCSAGSLSYGDNKAVMNEIYRVVKKGGAMVAVDSLNNNYIYKFNRYVHHLRGNRSKSTLERMPTVDLIKRYSKKFRHSKVQYFGAITWAFPLLSKILSSEHLSKLSNWIDVRFNIKKSAFKFVMVAIKNEK